MAFRRRLDEWDDFLQRYNAELRTCGLPDYLVTDKRRFGVFLDHGYDDWGRTESRHGFFDARSLSDEQIIRLAALIEQHIDTRYAVDVRSRWRPSG